MKLCISELGFNTPLPEVLQYRGILVSLLAFHVNKKLTLVFKAKSITEFCIWTQISCLNKTPT